MTTKPTPYFRFEIRSEVFIDVFASFGLLNNLSKFFENQSQLSAIFLDPIVREGVIQEMLSERDERGNIKKAFNTHTIQASEEHIFELLEWLEEHLKAFFTQAFGRATKALQKHNQVAQKNS